ncbi:hypothetical protein LTR37_007841 [Vermiconidia calcicola]|uniref:Uncharacterized protein n=1 Tax=Vermiconidia calcicola TaxID=1690605 RepID=A0ACC3NEZ3_9PEZI|nr:hypothetical protein LTR37_007841 [Vermiconidia calcicola]
MATTSPEHGASGEDFVYSPLKDATREIRVAHLSADLAVTPDGKQIPQCTLEHCDLEPSTQYTALSYAWGDAADTTPILLDGRQKQVTKSLASFLLSHSSNLRGSNMKGEPFWIDALCINQSDDTEKNHQVAMMDRIFKNAAHMYIWLGEASEDSHLVFLLLRGLAVSYDEVATFEEASSDRSTNPIDGGVDHLSRCFQKHLKALNSLVSRPWWERAWVQQEVYFAPRHKTFMICGKDGMRWHDVVLGYSTLCYLRQKSKQRAHQYTVHNILNCITKMTPTCRHSDHQSWANDRTLTISLAQHLYQNRISHYPRMASLPVDHVYTSVDKIVQPDYSRSMEEVYIETARHTLRAVEAVTFSFRDGLSHDISLPSWVPNWSGEFIRAPLPNAEDIFIRQYTDRYTASGIDSEFSHQAFGPKLQVQGAQLDLVGDEVKLSSLFWSEKRCSSANFSRREWLKKYRDFIDSLLSQKDLSAGLFNDVWWRIPIADSCWSYTDMRYSRASSTSRGAFHELLRMSRLGLTANAELGSLVEDEQRFGVVEYLKDMDSSRNRMPFVSASGRIGLGPTEIEPGDKIFIILGHKVPIILRDAGNGELRIVGDAYVYGLMDGEAMEQDPKIEMITLV